MKYPLFCSTARLRRATTSAGGVLLGLILTTKAHAQGQIPSGSISGSGAGPYSYSLAFSDAAGATSPIGSVWYAWVPGSFYLPASPTSASAPAGWTAAISRRQGGATEVDAVVLLAADAATDSSE